MFIAVVTSVLIFAVITGVSGRVADDDARRARLEWAEFHAQDCPADLPESFSPQLRCDWRARRRRCADFDVCWFRCTVNHDGDKTGGGCEHLCNANIRAGLPALNRHACR